jgi:PAS domain S-box-containing protein
MPFQHNGIVMIDLNGRVQYANSFACDLLGIEHDEISAESGGHFTFPQDLDEARLRFANCKAGNSELFHFRLRHKNGTPIWVDATCSSLQTPSGAVYGVLVTVAPRKNQNGSQADS